MDSIFFLLCKFASEHALAVAPYVCRPRFAECGSGGLTQISFAFLSSGGGSLGFSSISDSCFLYCV